MLMRGTIEDTENGPIAISIESRLVKDRHLFLTGEINEDSATALIQALLYLDSITTGEPIMLYIDSPGGSVTSGMCIIDVMRLLKSPVHTRVIGTAASMAALVLMAGERGERKALKNSWILLHEMSSGDNNKYSDKLIYMKRLEIMNSAIVSLIKECSKMKQRTISQFLRNDTWIDPHAALDYGIIDQIL